MVGIGEKSNWRKGTTAESRKVKGRTKGPEAPWGEEGFVAIVGTTIWVSRAVA